MSYFSCSVTIWSLQVANGVVLKRFRLQSDTEKFISMCNGEFVPLPPTLCTPLIGSQPSKHLLYTSSTAVASYSAGFSNEYCTIVLLLCNTVFQHYF